MRRRAFPPRGKSRPRRPRLELLEARLLLATVGGVTTPDPSTLAGISATYGQLPLSFEANQGQTDGRVSFLSHGGDFALFLSLTQAVLSLQQPGAGPAHRPRRQPC